MIKALRRMAAILRVGGSMDQALEDVVSSNNIPEIVRDELGKVYASYKAGFSINESFYSIYKNIGTKDTLYLCSAIDIQMETGGDKAEVLDSIATQISSRNLKQRGIKSKLAEINISVKFMMGMPIVLGIIMLIIKPSHFDYFTADFMGQVIGFAIVASIVVGYSIIKKMSKIQMD